MKTETRQLMARAEDCLRAAEKNVQMNELLTVLNRAYYAAFDAARAMLFEFGFETLKTHAGVHAKFNEIFIKTGLFEQEVGGHLKRLFEARQSGDYDFSIEIDEADAINSLELARRFLAEARAFFAAQKP